MVAVRDGREVDRIVEVKTPADLKAFVERDSESSPQVVAKYEVKHIPTMVAVRDGREVDRIVEVKTPADLKAFVERNL